jgi:hypothetical protein
MFKCCLGVASRQKQAHKRQGDKLVESADSSQTAVLLLTDKPQITSNGSTETHKVCAFNAFPPFRSSSVASGFASYLRFALRSEVRELLGDS